MNKEKWWLKSSDQIKSIHKFLSSQELQTEKLQLQKTFTQSVGHAYIRAWIWVRKHQWGWHEREGRRGRLPDLFLIPHSMFNVRGWALGVWFPPIQRLISTLRGLSGIRLVPLNTASVHMPPWIVLHLTSLQLSCSSAGQTQQTVHSQLFIAWFY